MRLLLFVLLWAISIGPAVAGEVGNSLNQTKSDEDITADWFEYRDLNRDECVSLAEFEDWAQLRRVSPKYETAKVAEFRRLDLNNDGCISRAEMLEELERKRLPYCSKDKHFWTRCKAPPTAAKVISNGR